MSYVTAARKEAGTSACLVVKWMSDSHAHTHTCTSAHRHTHAHTHTHTHTHTPHYMYTPSPPLPSLQHTWQGDESRLQHIQYFLQHPVLLNHFCNRRDRRGTVCTTLQCGNIGMATILIVHHIKASNYAISGNSLMSQVQLRMMGM